MRPRRTLRHPRARVLAVPAVAAALAVTGLPALGASSSGPAVPALPSVIPAWAALSPLLGVTAPSSTVRFAVALRYRDAAGLASVAQQVSDPTSPQFRHFLTTAQIEQRYAPTPAAATTVTAWLTGLGVTVDGVSPLRGVISAHATTATLTRALHVSFSDVLRNGARVRVARNEPAVPASIRGLVAGIDGLSQVVMQPSHVSSTGSSDDSASFAPKASPPAAYNVGAPCSAYWAEKKATTLPKYNGKVLPYAVCGYTPDQLRGAYGVTQSGLTGAGAKVAVIDAWASPTLEYDVNTWSTRHGLPAFTAGQLTQETLPGVSQVPEVNPGGLGLIDPQGWSGEETLDVEAVHSMAPGASITYLGALTPENVTLALALTQIVEENKVDEVTNSYGSQDDAPLVIDQIMFDQSTNVAAAEGMGLSFSSGDSADEVVNSGVRQVDFPSDSPMVTAVGGTALVVGPNNTYGGETYWGNEKAPIKDGKWDKPVYNAGGGGGVSTVYAEPSYQKGVVPSSLATYGGVPAGRVTPDISLVADSTTGFLMGQTQTNKNGSVSYGELRIGGTSVSSPLWAGLMADVIQSMGGKRIGLANPSLYTSSQHRGAAYRDPSLGRSLAAVRSDHSDTQDPTSPIVYALRDMGIVGTLHDLPGYDDSTGLGTPYLPQLALAIANPTQDGPKSLTHPTVSKLPGTIVRLSIVTQHRKAKNEIQVPAGKKVTYKVQLVLGTGVKKGPSTLKRTVYIYVDGKRRGHTTTGKGGFGLFVGAPLSKGKHIVSAVFFGTKDLKTSVSHKLTVRAI